MLEILLCSLVTVFPDYMFRRYWQNKRIGHEITIFSVWFELRWGITGCVVLAVCLITVIFYNHPSTTNVTLFFRTVPVIPEAMLGRVSEVYVEMNGKVAKGAPIFKLDSARQEATAEVARRKIAETEAEMRVAQLDIVKADAQIQEARAAHQQAVDELETKRELQRRSPGTVPFRDIERLEVTVEGRLGSLNAATASKQSLTERANAVLPAQKASAQATLAQAEVDIEKTYVRAGVAGQVEQFTLRVGDIVNPLSRAGGILIPEGAGTKALQAGFSQIEAQIMKVGMIAEVTCISKPWVIIPMVVTDVQDFIAAGQFRGGDQLLDAQQTRAPGTLLVHMEPLFPGGLQGVTPGSSCIANAYSNNHDIIAAKETGFLRGLWLHAVDALGLVHALILRLQALMLPFKLLVFSGH